VTLEVGTARVVAAQPCGHTGLIPHTMKKGVQIQYVLFDRATLSLLQDAPSKNLSASKSVVGIQKACGYLPGLPAVPKNCTENDQM